MPHLAALAEAVWGERRIALDYERGDQVVRRVVEPLGVVLKAGVWYLVASSEGQIRTYRASRVAGVTPLAEPFERPPGFDLAAHWSESTAAYERDTPRVEVTVRIDPQRLDRVADAIGERVVNAAERLDAPDPDGWLRLRLRLDWPDEVPGRLLSVGFGPRGPRAARDARPARPASGRGPQPLRRERTSVAGAGRPGRPAAADTAEATPERLAGRPERGRARRTGSRLPATGRGPSSVRLAGRIASTSRRRRRRIARSTSRSRSA